MPRINAKDGDYKDKFSSLYDNLDTNKKAFIIVPLMYFARRYLMVLAIIYLQEYPVF